MATVNNILIGMEIFKKYGKGDAELSCFIDELDGPEINKCDMSQDDVIILEANGWEEYKGEWFLCP